MQATDTVRIALRLHALIYIASAEYVLKSAAKGPIAQLVERVIRIDEVRSSTLLGSTKVPECRAFPQLPPIIMNRVLGSIFREGNAYHLIFYPVCSSTYRFR